MRILVLSDTFPNALDPWRGPYNRRQVECLAELCSVTVINPLPWVKLLSGTRYWGLTSDSDDVLEGIPLYHPTFWYLPVLGRNRTWRGVLSAARRALKKERKQPYDLILATFAYPHGLAACELARELGIPYVIKARGSDLHSLPKSGPRRERTMQAVQDAAAVVAVSRNLADIAVEMGAQASQVTVLPNGIDADVFDAIPRHEARGKLGLPLDREMILFVGSLSPVKGVDILLKAFDHVRRKRERMPLLTLLGSGPMRWTIERQLADAGLRDAVKLPGHRERNEVALWMNAANLLVLPSRNEGCPNVVLEALSCGTPVVASRVGAVPDLLGLEGGETVAPNDPEALAEAILRVLDRTWVRAMLRWKIKGRSWRENAEKLHSILMQSADTIHAGRTAS